MTLTNKTILGAIGLAIIVGAFVGIQDHCGKIHETAGTVAGTIADTHAAELKDLKAQLTQKETEITNAQDAARSFKKKYEAAKAKIPTVPLPAPVTESGLTESLKVVGFRDDVAVQIGVPSILNTIDATLVFDLDQEAKRAKALDEALISCASALQASEVVVKGQGDALNLSAKALTQSEAEAAARAIQAQELGKALKIEKDKKWQKYLWGAAGVALVLVVKK